MHQARCTLWMATSGYSSMLRACYARQGRPKAPQAFQRLVGMLTSCREQQEVAPGRAHHMATACLQMIDHEIKAKYYAKVLLTVCL